MKQPIKMTPGDDTHLSLLMAPYSLNLVTGQDRRHLLGYGRSAFEAGKASQCLHQIQEPEADIWPCVNIDVDASGKITNAKLYSPGLPAGNHDVYPVRVPYMDEHTEAWHACVDELEKAVPGFMSLGNMNGIECAVAAIRGLSERAKHQEPAAAEQAAWHAGLDEGRAQAAPAAVAEYGSREERMVVLQRGHDGIPTVWCDPEIADIVGALNSGGVKTVASCSGHGEKPGGIALADGRQLLLLNSLDAFNSAISTLCPSASAPAAVAVPDERAAFEQWMAERHMTNTIVKRNAHDENYFHASAQTAWDVWQARAALAATPAHHAPDAKRLIEEAKAHASKASRLTRVLLNEPTGTLADTDIAIWIEHAQQLLNTLAATPAAAPAVPKWIDDPHDIEQGQMLNPEWVRQQQPAIMPKGESAAAQLRAMATNYPAGHSWDKLDAKACIRGALEIEALRALLATATGLPAQAVPSFCHVASLKLKSLQERGYQITGYALEKPVEGAQPERGFINHGGFVGWWWDGQSPQAQADARDAAFEAVRKAFCKLQRYSFFLDDKGNVRRTADYCGNWVEFEAVHTLFEPAAVDAAIAAAKGEGQ